MLLLEETAREVAKENRRATQNNDSAEAVTQNVVEQGEWTENVGEKIGVSKETVRKGTDVYRFAYPDQFVHDDLQMLAVGSFSLFACSRIMQPILTN